VSVGDGRGLFVQALQGLLHPPRRRLRNSDGRVEHDSR
jgi:hypothetical protein